MKLKYIDDVQFGIPLCDFIFPGEGKFNKQELIFRKDEDDYRTRENFYLKEDIEEAMSLEGLKDNNIGNLSLSDTFFKENEKGVCLYLLPSYEPDFEVLYAFYVYNKYFKKTFGEEIYKMIKTVFEKIEKEVGHDDFENDDFIQIFTSNDYLKDVANKIHDTMGVNIYEDCSQLVLEKEYDSGQYSGTEILVDRLVKDFGWTKY